MWTQTGQREGRQRERERGYGLGFVSQVRSRGGAVGVGARGRRAGGAARCGWDGGGRGEIRGTAVVSRSLRLTGDITLRHGWRDRGRDGYPSREMSTSRHRCDTHTHTHEPHRHTGTQRSRTKESGVFEREKGWLQWADEQITLFPFKKEGDGNEGTKQKKRLRVADY